MCFKTENMRFKMAFSLKKPRAEARGSSLNPAFKYLTIAQAFQIFFIYLDS